MAISLANREKPKEEGVVEREAKRRLLMLVLQVFLAILFLLFLLKDCGRGTELVDRSPTPSFDCTTFPLPDGATVLDCGEFVPGSGSWNMTASTASPEAGIVLFYRERLQAEFGVELQSAPQVLGKVPGTGWVGKKGVFSCAINVSKGSDGATWIGASWKNDSRLEAMTPEQQQQALKLLKTLQADANRPLPEAPSEQ